MKPRWTKDPKVRWIGLNDVAAVSILVMNALLVYGAVMGYYNGPLRTLLISANMAAFGIVMYWLYGPEAAEGGADVIGVAGEGDGPPDGEESSTEDSETSQGDS